MESFEKTIKIILVSVLLIAGLLYVILPKVKIRKKLIMDDRAYKISQIIGLISGISGLSISIIYPELLINLHLWELIIMPYVLIQTYWLLIMRIKKSTTIIDEKQDFDMTKAGGLTFGFSIPPMMIIFLLYQDQIISGAIWFPFYLFTAISMFSGITLYLFKKT